MTSASTERVNELYRAHRNELVQFLRGEVGSTALAEEIVQEVFAIVLKRIETLSDDLRPGYLFQVAVNLARRHGRRQRRRSQIDARRAEMQTGELTIADRTEQPEERVLAEEIGRHIGEVVEKLQPLLREAFVLGCVKQMTAQEIAGRLKVSVGTVEQRIAAATKKIAGRLKGRGFDPAKSG